MPKKVIAGALSIVALLTASISGVWAATNTPVAANTDNGLRIAPVRTDITLQPGQTKEVPVYITDETKSPVTLQVVINNFIANGTTGIPNLIYSQHSSYYDPNDLKQFIAPIPNITLQPYKETFVNVKISIPKNNPGGGYYAAVRFAPAYITQSKNVTLSASVASLILVKVPGPGLKEQVSLSSFNVQDHGQPGRFFFSSNSLQAVAAFTNTGNVQEEPFGKVEVQNMSGKVIMTKQINTGIPPGNVLPGSKRVFNVKLSELGSFGKYKVSGFFGYGTTGQLLSASTTIYVVAPWIIGLVVLIILLIIALIFLTPRLFRAWYRRSIRKAKVS
jgi:hypothetical protein